MANQTGNIYRHGYREKKEIINRELYNRFEIVSQTNGIKGEIFVPKDLTFDAAETLTLTVAADNSN